MKKQTARITADRAEQLKKSNVRAGKGKGSTAARKLQNAEVKDGTIRIGKIGKSYNVNDAQTGTRKRGVLKAAAAPSRTTTRVPPSARGEGAGAKPKYRPTPNIGRDVTPPKTKTPKQYGTGVYRSR